ncbi:hypothetical protein [Arthrobacter sp.]|uniref:hypothetical protein n=1 Tax=Arthrobacter sp. TaxID=1667 RepID=UPI0026E0DE22|nr:hypothetical protein [Arthrobacter sp.]MDO5751772.1 hypothetical protein [Arthrobacter sp.]
MSRRSRRIATLLTVTVVCLGLLIGGGAWLVGTLRDTLAPGLSTGCTATVGDASYKLALDQSQNASLITTLAVQRGMPARAASIALATALQESKLRNIDYGDLDSIGLFQQRPSQGWGSVDEIMDPAFSANAFYDALAQVPGYVDMPVNDAAQIVQRSGYPHAYGKHEALSRAFASAMAGQTPASLNCTLPTATSGSNPQDVISAAQAAVGLFDATTTVNEAGTLVHVPVSPTHGWIVANWALANAHQFGIVEISHAGQTWNRSANTDGRNVGWQAGGSATPELVAIQLAPAIQS